MNDFIGIYDNALTAQQCDAIVARFEASDKVARGRTGNGVDTGKKDSWDLTIGPHPEWHDVGNVEQGGETEFLYQARKVEARKGRLVIAPAGFTHTHKGHVPLSGDKLIATSWILFRRAEELFGKPAAE